VRTLKALVLALGLTALACGCAGGGGPSAGERDDMATGGSGVTVFGTVDAGVSHTTTRTGR